MAGFAASAALAVGSDVEAESSRLVAANLGIRQACVEVADCVEDLDVGGGVRSGRAADGRLVDIDDLVEVFEAVNAFVSAGIDVLGTVEVAGEGFADDVVYQRTLAGAGNAGDANESPKGISTVRFLRLLCLAPRTVSQWVERAVVVASLFGKRREGACADGFLPAVVAGRAPLAVDSAEWLLASHSVFDWAAGPVRRRYIAPDPQPLPHGCGSDKAQTT